MRSASTPGNRSGMLLFVLLVEFLLGVESGAFQLVLADMGSFFGMSYGLQGTMVTAENVAVVIMPLLFGPVADRHGKKKTITVFLGILLAGALVISGAPDTAVLFTGILLVGSGYGVAECIACASLSDSDPAKAERNMNVTQAAYSFGAMTGPLLTTMIMQLWPTWRAAFVITAAGTILVLCVLTGIRFTKPAAVLEQPGTQKKRAGLFTVTFIGMIIGITLYTGMEQGTAFFTDSLYTDVLDAPASGALALTLFWLAMAVSRLVFGFLNAKKNSVTVALYVLSSAVLAVLILTRSVPVALVLTTAVGFLYGPIWPQLMSAATTRYAERSARASGIMMAGAGVGAMAAPLALGFASDSLGLAGGFWILICCGAAGSLILGWTGRKRTEPAK